MSRSLLALALLVAVFLIRKLVRYTRLKHVPGPLPAALSSLWLVYAQLTGRMHIILHDLTKQYGPIARISPDWVVCGDAIEIRKILAVRSTWTRANWYRGMRIDPYRDVSFSTIDDHLHNAIRNKLVPGYSGKDIANLEDLIDAQIESFVSLIEGKCSKVRHGCTGAVVDLAEKVQYLTLDIISSIAFGRPFGYIQDNEDKFGYIETTGKLVYIMVATTLIPGVISLLQSPYLKWLMPRIKDMAGIGDMMRLVEKIVAERFGADAIIRKDMLGSFVARGLEQADAEEEAIVQIVAGSDTTATAIRSTILYIITSPPVYRRLQAEINSAASAGLISSPITDSEARKFPYLQAVILEGLRHWPPAAALYPKVSTQDHILSGIRIPARTNVSWSPWSLMRDESVFGEDADLFLPERWLSPQKTDIMEQTVMMVFSAGSRWECLGRHIAMMELNKAFVEIFRRFELSLVDPIRPWKSFNAGLFSQKDMKVLIKPRNNPV